MAALWCLKLCGARAGVGWLENKALRGHLESKGFVRVISAPLRGGELTKSPRPTHSGLCRPARLCHFCMRALGKPICKPIWWQHGSPGGVAWEACDVASSPQM